MSMTHEALAREWPRLAGWMEADREALADLRDLRGSIGPWLASGRDPDRLLRGASLARATTAATARPDLLSTDEGAFLAASTQLATAASRRARRVTAAVAILATVALVGAGLAVFQRQDARASAQSERQARSQADLGRLGLQAQVLANGPTDLALLLAVESWRREPGPSSEAALLTALTARPLVERYIAADSPDQRTGRIVGPDADRPAHRSPGFARRDPRRHHARGGRRVLRHRNDRHAGCPTTREARSRRRTRAGESSDGTSQPGSPSPVNSPLPRTRVHPSSTIRAMVGSWRPILTTDWS